MGKLKQKKALNCGEVGKVLEGSKGVTFRVKKVKMSKWHTHGPIIESLEVSRKCHCMHFSCGKQTDNLITIYI